MVHGRAKNQNPIVALLDVGLQSSERNSTFVVLHSIHPNQTVVSLAQPNRVRSPVKQSVIVETFRRFEGCHLPVSYAVLVLRGTPGLMRKGPVCCKVPKDESYRQMYVAEGNLSRLRKSS